RDNAEHVQCIGLVRLRLEGAAAERLAFDESSGGAVLLGLAEEIGNRGHRRAIAEDVTRMEPPSGLRSVTSCRRRGSQFRFRYRQAKQVPSHARLLLAGERPQLPQPGTSKP